MSITLNSVEYVFLLYITMNFVFATLYNIYLYYIAKTKGVDSLLKSLSNVKSFKISKINPLSLRLLFGFGAFCVSPLLAFMVFQKKVFYDILIVERGCEDESERDL